MTEDIDRIKEELDEIRRIKEDLRDELDEVRRIRKKSRIRPPKPPRPRAAIVDLRGLTDSLEDMMEGLGDQIRESLKGVEEIGEAFSGPALHVRSRRKGRQEREDERIPPERVARVVSPLGSEERLKILDFLKDGGRSFNELENHTGKTGSSLTHHLSPLVEAGYVIKGEVRGTYYVTVEGRLAYRLAQWLTGRVERERSRSGNNGNGESEIKVVIEDDEDEPSEEDDW
ncbi:MAG: ArsR/SmtB family transcription factor [Candidatus Thorarchaeota archaeon]